MLFTQGYGGNIRQLIMSPQHALKDACKNTFKFTLSYFYNSIWIHTLTTTLIPSTFGMGATGAVFKILLIFYLLLQSHSSHTFYWVYLLHCAYCSRNLHNSYSINSRIIQIFRVVEMHEIIMNYKISKNQIVLDMNQKWKCLLILSFMFNMFSPVNWELL